MNNLAQPPVPAIPQRLEDIQQCLISILGVQDETLSILRGPIPQDNAVDPCRSAGVEGLVDEIRKLANRVSAQTQEIHGIFRK